MKIGIVLITYSRLDMINLTVPALLECRGIKNFPVYVAQDGGPSSIKVSKAMSEYAVQNKWKIRIAKKRLGLPVNFVTGINESFKAFDLDAVIIGEDDVLLAKDGLEYIEWGLNKFKEDKEVFGIATHSPVRNKEEGKIEEIAFRPKLNLMWAALWKDNWNYFYRYWLREGYPAKRIWSIDACMDNVILGWKGLAAYPRQARSTHVGWYGTNATKKEAADKKWTVDTMFTRCPNFEKDHKVSPDKYRIIKDAKKDGYKEMVSKRVYPHDNPWVENWRVE